MARVELRVVEISSQLTAQQQATTALLSDIATRVREPGHTGLEPIPGDNGLSQTSSIARLREHRVVQNMTHQNLPPNPGTLCIRTEMHSFRLCKKWCSCCCHAQQSVRFPRALRNMIGLLFVGYSGIPILTPSCNEKRCLKRSSPSMHVSYYFPTWLLSRVLNVTASFKAFDGPQLTLNVPRVVDWWHPLWRPAYENNVGAIQTLFSEGLASPFVIGVYGQSALHVGRLALSARANFCTFLTKLQYAAMNGHIECCKFLIQQGADPYLKDKNGR